ncbi:uncharacterized protein LOC126970771 [Leptidea sinapis]|uniref:uncharacterized protein LOC126970771 n=1 Tax=Leptidea sinapis TaxID=189913 RepID=UPI0021C3E616|nr:uncharacterized protein LOC126970771 [Leptidea sinapis]
MVPYSETNCGGECESVYILDRCKDNVVNELEPQREMFPLDLKGCPLITYAVISEPYVMPPERKVLSKKWNDVYEFEKGSEINLVKIISQRAAFDRNFAVVSSRRQAMYMDQKLGRGEPLIYCFPESNNLYKYGVALLAREWYPMLERLNNIIRSVSENGLIEKWNEELFIHTIGSEGTSAILPLGMKHLLGAFMLIGILYLVSIVVFFGEMIISFTEKRKQVKNFVINLT